jgi:hypothetical protein
MTSIPGSNYQISGSNFIAPDGNQLTQQQFLDRVNSREISLTENSLQFLSNHLGPDMMQSLRQSMPSSPQTVSARLEATEANMGEIYDLMKVLAQFAQDQRKSASELRTAQYGSQIDAMQKSADEAMGAARARLAAGIIGGALTIGSGAISCFSAVGSFEGLTKTDMNLKQNLSFGEGLSKGVDGVNKITTSFIELGAAGHEKNAKERDIDARKAEQAAQQTTELLDAIRELNSKAKEVLSGLVQANREMPRV